MDDKSLSVNSNILTTKAELQWMEYDIQSAPHKMNEGSHDILYLSFPLYIHF